MELGDTPLEPVGTSCTALQEKVVHPLGQILLSLSLGAEPTTKTKMVCSLIVDIPSAYNVILSRSILNAFQVVTSIYHMKLKFPAGAGVGEVRGDQYVARKCYVESIKRRQPKGHGSKSP
ncbi:UNVERIFIED_CONTAM: hypothetical protein Slati_0156700 [Sesamum latifolium]|uniref:Uncharacterized protein n=1 Tax=Sesamum latifolium TaxID=2727402 RepID=A0AAW2YAE6_9LAMI